MRQGIDRSAAYNWVWEIVERFLSNGPNLKQDHPKAPDVTGWGVLVVVESLMGSNGGVMIKSVLYKFHKQLCVNNIKVTVNTCTCTNVFTVITTKDQSGGIYNTCSCTIGGQGLWLQTNLVLGLHPQTWPIYCHKSFAFCYNFKLTCLLKGWIRNIC